MVGNRSWTGGPAGRRPSIRSPPSVAVIEQVTSEILVSGKKLNDARLHGFIHDVVQRQPLKEMEDLPEESR
jgi:hypothetical protein